MRQTLRAIWNWLVAKFKRRGPSLDKKECPCKATTNNATYLQQKTYQQTVEMVFDQLYELEEAFASTEISAGSAVDTKAILRLANCTMVLGASIRGLPTAMLSEDHALALTLIHRYAIVSGRLRVAIINLQKDPSVLTKEVNTELTNYRVIDYTYSSDINRMFSQAVPHCKCRGGYSFASVHTEDTRWIFEYYAPAVITSADNAALRAQFSKSLFEVITFLHTRQSVCFLRDAVYVSVGLLSGTGSPIGVLPASRLWDRYDSVDGLAEKIADSINTFRNLPLYGYRSAQHAGVFFFSVEAVGSQISECGVWPGHMKVLADAGYMLIEDEPLLEQNKLHVETDNLDSWEIKQVGSGLEVVRRARKYSDTLRPFVLHLCPGAILAFNKGVLERLPEIGLVREKPLAVHSTTKQEIWDVDVLTTKIADLESSRMRASTPATPPRHEDAHMPRNVRKFSTSTPRVTAHFRYLEKTVLKQPEFQPYTITVLKMHSYNNSLKGFGLYDGSNYTYHAVSKFRNAGNVFPSCDATAQHVYNSCSNHIVIGHNLFTIDFVFIADALLRCVVKNQGLTSLRNAITVTRNKETITKFVISKPCGAKITFLDSSHLLPVPLGGMTRIFGLHGMAPEVYTNKSEGESDNHADCMLLFHALKAFEKLVYRHFSLIAFESATLTGLSYRIFLAETPEVIKHKLAVPEQRTENFLRQAYRGGRTEVFKHYARASSTESLHFIDFVSLYPAVAQHYTFPSGPLEYVDQGEIDLTKFGIHYAQVSCDPATIGSIPYLPVRYGQETLYPTGSWREYYTSHEIRQAQSRGYTVEPLYGLQFADSACTFDAFVNKVYTIKYAAEVANNSGLRSITKLVLNSLFGRLAQSVNHAQAKIVLKAPDQHYTASNSELQGNYQMPQSSFSLVTPSSKTCEDTPSREPLTYDVAPQLSAFVTAYARTHLHVALEIIAGAGGTILYADTDSVAYSAPRGGPPIDSSYVNKKLLQTGYIKETNLADELGVVKDIYPNELILNVLFMSPKMYLVETTKGVYTKTAGVGLTSGWGETDEAKRAWALLKGVVHNRESQSPSVLVTSESPVKVNLDKHGLLSTIVTQKNLAEGILSEKRRHRVFTKDGKYVGTRPVHVVMSEEGYTSQQEFQPAPSNCFWHSETLLSRD